MNKHMSDHERAKSTAANADDRLASALRENLFRRKAQARARAHNANAVDTLSHNTISDDRQSSDTESDMKG